MQTAVYASVFPAYAGVILVKPCVYAFCSRVPRVCGGDPVVLAGPAPASKCSPRMRG